MEHERLHAVVEGRVQGVNFRQSAQQQARRLGLVGWVMNLDDGTVEFVAEGPRAKLHAMLAWLRRGPPAAEVRAVRDDWLAATGEFHTFRARWRW